MSSKIRYRRETLVYDLVHPVSAENWIDNIVGTLETLRNDLKENGAIANAIVSAKVITQDEDVLNQKIVFVIEIKNW